MMLSTKDGSPGNHRNTQNLHSFVPYSAGFDA